VKNSNSAWTKAEIKGTAEVNSLALDRSVIAINEILQQMARLMGPAKTLFWWFPASPEKNSWPKNLFLVMVNSTRLEANSCIILGMGVKMLQSEEPLEASDPWCPTFVHVA